MEEELRQRDKSRHCGMQSDLRYFRLFFFCSDCVLFCALCCCSSLQDTEFPGVVARPGGTFKTSPDYAYQTLKCNVDMLKIIQLGLCFCDAQGNIHPGTCTWQVSSERNSQHAATRSPAPKALTITCLALFALNNSLTSNSA